MTLKTRSILPIILGFSCQLLYASDVVLVPGRPVRLVPEDAPFPLVAPAMSSRALFKQGLFEFYAQAGPWYNQKRVYEEVQKRFEVALKSGLKDAASSGQNGVLFKIEVLQQPVEAGTNYSLRGDGVAVVGVGPDANAVCFATRCDEVLNVPLQPGQSLADGFGYIWVSPNGAKFDTARYDIGAMEARTRTLRGNAAASESYRTAVRVSALDGYARRLGEISKSKADSLAVDALIKNRDESIARVKEVERQLEEAMKRAERAARTAAVLDGIAAAFSLASAIAQATFSLREDVTKDGPITSMEELKERVKQMTGAANKQVEVVALEHLKVVNALDGYATELLSFGIRYKNDAPPPRVISIPKQP